MTLGPFGEGSGWPGTLSSDRERDLASALASIGRGLSEIGQALAVRGGGSATASGFTSDARSEEAAWPGWAADADEREVVEQLRGQVGQRLQQARRVVEEFVDFERARPNPRARLLRLCEDYLSTFDEVEPMMWRHSL